ncbi:hypothetical protein H9Q08_12720 [Chryseobacterium sp. PS-8]|uniref:DUF6705 domain-containing protein n=1 Tax=Chryseobacterium indicum TaxID=2766954 RepID=A0ABS9C6H5_9FLAO|nr:DUF6705 family protein [Chryseobacterium sp. PS-8]MCF2220165.1 hypothetical protein [Chryseobacterium sp. PS-8]
MKKIFLFIILTILFSQHLKSQIIEAPEPYTVFDLAQGIDYHVKDLRYYKDINGTLNPFIGVWKNTTGNKTFKVTLKKKEMILFTNGFYYDGIEGDFIVIQNEGQPNETVLFNSKYPTNDNVPFPEMIMLHGIYPQMGGVVYDNSRWHSDKSTWKEFLLLFKILPGNTTAQWITDERSGMKDTDPYVNPYIPKDIILTKQ